MPETDDRAQVLIEKLGKLPQVAVDPDQLAKNNDQRLPKNIDTATSVASALSIGASPNYPNSNSEVVAIAFINSTK